MAQSHGPPSFVMPLEGPGSVARPFCCRAGAWWPTLAQQGHLATYVPRRAGGGSGQQLLKRPQNGQHSWLPFFCDAIGGAWKCCSSFLLSGRRMVANPSPTRPFSYVRILRRAGGCWGQQLPKRPQNGPKSCPPFFCDAIGGAGRVARPFCCRAGAWWPTLALAQQGHLATYVLRRAGGCWGQHLLKRPQNGPKSWLPFFCDAIGGAWKCCSSFLLSGRRMVANPSPTRP